MRGIQPPPLRFLCAVYHDDVFVGCVITSADVDHLPFRRLPGYVVPVLHGVGDTRHILNNLLRWGRETLAAQTSGQIKEEK